MSATQPAFSSSLGMSPPPPNDLGSYARTMHQHTKRQMMESLSHVPSETTQHSQHSSSAATRLPDGLSDGSKDRSRDSSQHSDR